MADITLCTNKECVKKFYCKRFTEKPNDFMQSYCKFIPKDNLKYGFECEYFLNNIKPKATL